MSQTQLKENDSILSFVYPNDNDKFSKMQPIDQKELVRRITCYPWTLRKSLNLNPNHTFGLEIEFDNAQYSNIKKFVNQNPDFKKWKLSKDITVMDGGELITPIMYDSADTWQKVKTSCKRIDKNASITSDCGGHLHIGAQILGNDLDSWLVFANTYAINENLLFKFGYGDFLYPREEIEDWALPKARNWIKKLDKLHEYDINTAKLIKKLRHDRYDAVNLTNINLDNIAKLREGNTIEFRSPNGTLNPIIWQNNVNTYVHLLDYCANAEYDSKRFKKTRKDAKYYASNLVYYDEVFLDQALRFADSIFDTNLDKIYFLKQYLGNYEVEDDKKLVLR